MLHTINLEPDSDTLDAADLSHLIRLWLADCRARLPAITCDGYEDKTTYFLDWWAGVSAWKRHELSADDLQQFAGWLSTTQTRQHKPLAANTRRDVLRRLRQCLRWAYAVRHYLPIDVSAWVPVLPPAKRIQRVATVDELRRLLAAADHAADPLRDRAALALLIQTGMRRAELASVQVETIVMAADWSGTLRVAGKRTRANATGERIVAFDVLAGSHLVPYLDAHGWRDGPMLRGVTGGPVALKTVERIVTRAASRAGLADVVQGCHDLRRAFITHFRRRYRGAGYDHLLRLQVGHASDAVSDIYDLADEVDLAEVIRGPL
ncbi:MAG: site-specific integrase [Caldilineaceae bacterium]|nr:site-specific integrase [Caldilineaceae bacterium]